MTWSLINPLVSSYRGGVDGCIERSFFLSLLICLGLLFPAIPAPASEEDSAFHQHLGNRALIEKRYDEAQSEFEKGWHLDSTRAHIPIGLARVAAAKRDTPAVREWLFKALRRLEFGERADPAYTLLSRHRARH